jgi:hypothetical protein
LSEGRVRNLDEELHQAMAGAGSGAPAWTIVWSQIAQLSNQRDKLQTPT